MMSRENKTDNTTPSLMYRKEQLEQQQGKKLTKDIPVCCEIVAGTNCVVCYGFNTQGVLPHIVGAISLYGVSIKGAISYEWQQKGELCFYNQFYCDQHINIRRSIEIKKLVETQGKLLFNHQKVYAKKYIVEQIAEEVDKNIDSTPLIPIVQIEIQPSFYKQESCISIDVEGKDHPFLLYMICDALALYNLSVLELHIQTYQDNIHDTFLVQQKHANTQTIDLKKLHVSILLYIRFAYLIQSAPDPYQAIQRLQHIIQQVVDDDSIDIHSLLDVESQLTKKFAQVLGSGDYVWKDFIKTNAGEITKIFSNVQYERKGLQHFAYETMLTQLLQKAHTYAEKIQVINTFKDEQRYKVDIDALMMKESGFLYLSKHLSELAKVVIRHALYLVESHLQEQYGAPCSAAGIESKWILFGLGKFGGEALGFASDLEIQLIYTDYGHTNGTTIITNSEYFNMMLKELNKVIVSQKKGIFELDFRLRPHGQEGPLAIQLDNFIEYYRAGGKAHSVERIVLTRMRPIVGDTHLAERILQLRDEFIYFSSSIDPKEVIDMRQKQIEQEVKKGRRNAKFGAGALLDVEINVQLLQLRYGKQYPQLRHPNMYFILQNILHIDSIIDEEAKQLFEAYKFFRALINALRLRRGNATDVSLPPDDDWELTHLARRMGYKRNLLSTKEQLCLDFDTHSANVLHFVKNYIGKEAIRMKDLSPAALVYVEQEDIEKIPLLTVFKSPTTALSAIQNCTKQKKLQNEFAKILLLSWQHITRSGNADGIIVFLSRLSDMFTAKALKDFYISLLYQPRRLFILLDIISGSRYLAEEILKHPSYIEEICKEETSQKSTNFQEYTQALKKKLQMVSSEEQFLYELREYKKKHTLKIITQDICLGFPIQVIFNQLSNLAKAIVQAAFEYACKHLKYDGTGIAIFAFGKFGAGELNYSSDLDLLCVYTEHCLIEKQSVLELFKKTIYYLFEYTSSGRAYRIDLRLQPYGENHEVSSLMQFETYLRQHAKLWELQACIKLSCVAGDSVAGDIILQSIQHVIHDRLQKVAPSTIVQEIHSLRVVSVEHHEQNTQDEVLEVKHSWGGLRDIEFLVQGLQLVQYHTMLPKADTLGALLQLKEQGRISVEQYEMLVYDYCYLRRIEHFLQVYDNKQLHKIPQNDKNFKKRLTWLLIGEQDIDLLVRSLYKVKGRIQKWYNELRSSIRLEDTVKDA